MTPTAAGAYVLRPEPPGFDWMPPTGSFIVDPPDGGRPYGFVQHVYGRYRALLRSEGHAPMPYLRDARSAMRVFDSPEAAADAITVAVTR